MSMTAESRAKETAIAAESGMFTTRVTDLGIVVAMVAVLMLIWEGLGRYLDMPVYLVPKPSDFLAEFSTSSRDLIRHGLASAYVIVGAFVLGIAIGVPLAYVLVRFERLERGTYPLIVFLQIIPKTITAPLFIVWFGIGIVPKLVLTTIMTFFPVLVDSMAGFRSVDPRLYYITQTMGGSSWQTFRYIQLPTAMPHIFSGMKIASVYAVTAAIVVEFIGSNEGLGYLILQASGFMNMSLMFAGILATAILGLAFSLAISSLELLLMPWLRDQR
jgi:NitT/TauT family transport system permease protein